MKNGLKKCFLGIIPLVMLITACAGGAKPVESSAANSGGMTLDQALKEAAVRIDERIKAGSKIAPLNFNSPHDKFSGYVLDELTANLVDSGKLTVVDRKEVDLIRGEFDFQFSGEVGDDSMQELGRMLGAQSIISGSLTEVGGFYRIVIRVLNVQNASVDVQYRANIANDGIVTALLTGGKTAAVAAAPRPTPSGGSGTAAQAVTPAVQATAPVTAVPAQAAAPAPTPAAPSIAIEVTAKSGGKLFFQNKEIASLWDNDVHTIPIEGPGTYEVKMVFADHTETRSVVINTRGITKVSFGGTYTVGQAGPAGGLVFFDKGSYSDGWRYLEAASADIAGTSEWGARGKDVRNTNTGRGAGKRNTQAIVEYLRETGETGRAAQVVRDFRQGGYDDWFLPSRDELHLMYENLKQKGLGRFQNEIYWSSSADTDRYPQNNRAWYQNFDNGEQSVAHRGDFSGPYRDSTFRVRAVRAF